MSSPHEDTTRLDRDAAAHIEHTQRRGDVPVTVGVVGAQAAVTISPEQLVEEEAARMMQAAEAAMRDTSKLEAAYLEAMKRMGLSDREPVLMSAAKKRRTGLMAEIDPASPKDTPLGYAQFGQRTVLEFTRTRDEQGRPALEVTNMTALMAAEAVVNERAPYGEGSEEDRHFLHQAKSLADYRLHERFSRTVPTRTPIVIGRHSNAIEDRSHGVSEIMVDPGDTTMSRQQLRVRYDEPTAGATQRHAILDVEHLSDVSVTNLYDSYATDVVQVVDPHTKA